MPSKKYFSPGNFFGDSEKDEVQCSLRVLPAVVLRKAVVWTS